MLKDKVIIRSLEERDLLALVLLCEEHAIYEKAVYDPTGKVESLQRHFFLSENSINCLVISYQQILIGYASFVKQFSTWDANFYIYLDCLYLKEEYRGQGLGRLMMEELKKHAILEGCDVQWQTPDFNKPAIRFYESLGAEHKTKERFFWKLI